MDRYKLRQEIERHPDARLRDLVAELLREDIIALRIRPGSKLNVNQIASTLGVSRTPVAEAIGQLGEIGFVTVRPGTNGYYVLDLSLNDMISLYKVRTAIESEAAALCAHSLGEAAVQRLSELAEAFRDSVVRRDIRGMKDTDMPFHRMLIDGCGNLYLQQCYELLLPKLTMYQGSMTEFIARSGEGDNPWLPSVEYNHISIVSAIRMRMPELARQSMAGHVDASLNFTSLSGHGADPFQALRR